MKTKLILSTINKKLEFLTNLPFTPRINEWLNIKDLLRTEEINEIKQSAKCWSGIHGTVQSVEYRHDDNEFYTELIILCED
jgi:hypothetical protein